MSHSHKPCTLVKLQDPKIAVRFGDDETCLTRVVVKDTKLAVKFAQQIVINNTIDPTIGEAESVFCQLEAGANINVNRALALLPDGRVVHADKDTPAHCGQVIGFSAQSAVTGEMLKVVKFGVLSSATLGSIQDVFVLGNNGQLITTQPLSGFMLHVGIQLSGTDFFVSIKEPIQL